MRLLSRFLARFRLASARRGVDRQAASVASHWGQGQVHGGRLARAPLASGWAAIAPRALLTLLLALTLVSAQCHALSHEFAHWQGKAAPAEAQYCPECLLGHALDTPLASTPVFLPGALPAPLPRPAFAVAEFSAPPAAACARGPPR
ncbi:hypothetical protein GH865_09055 [Rhodocyclus tenuis]|uniref:hypothetical protein n=1 Tax=Rhodocyclus gracilis TaxID=2929842 RepID=UPI001298DAEF|nr:hypothetical protein [Rhodocyclus gracilis]MRD73391.1 hypothetical protein [Rhodocyclus gracilis]